MTSSASSSSPRASAFSADRSARRTRSPSSCSDASSCDSSSENEIRMLANSAEASGHVALRPLVGRLGEDLLGRVVLDEDAVARAVFVDVEAEERGHLGDTRGLL